MLIFFWSFRDKPINQLHQNTRQIKPEYIRTQPKIPIGRN